MCVDLFFFLIKDKYVREGGRGRAGGGGIEEEASRQAHTHTRTPKEEEERSKTGRCDESQFLGSIGGETTL